MASPRSRCKAGERGRERKGEPDGERDDSRLLPRVFRLTLSCLRLQPGPVVTSTYTHCVPISSYVHHPYPTHNVFIVGPNMGQIYHVMRPKVLPNIRREDTTAARTRLDSSREENG